MSGMPPETFAPAPPAPIPWEQPGYPMIKGLFETIGLFFTSPREAYRRMPLTSDLVRPLLYYVALGWVGVAIGQFWELLLRSMLPMESMFGGKMGEMLGGGGLAQSLVFIVIAPILLVVALFIWAGIVHLLLLLLGGASAGFLATVRVLCYAGTTQLLGFVPVCGGIVGAIWGIVLDIIGLSEAHKTTTGKAALAVLLPLLLCCVCAVIGIVFMGAGIASLVQGAR